MLCLARWRGNSNEGPGCQGERFVGLGKPWFYLQKPRKTMVLPTKTMVLPIMHSGFDVVLGVLEAFLTHGEFQLLVSCLKKAF